MDDAKARNGIEAVQELIDWQAHEIERLKDVIRAQDQRDGTTTARLSMTLGPTMICVTCPTVDERKVASFLFAGVSEWMRVSAMGTLMKLVDREEATRLLTDAWEDPMPVPGKREAEAPIGEGKIS